MYAQAKKTYVHPSENSMVWDKNKHFTWHSTSSRSVAQVIFPLFECLKLISQYSHYSFLGKHLGNSKKNTLNEVSILITCWSN